MKYFLAKAFLFAAPIVFLALFTFKFYSEGKKDLLRIGYVIDLFPDYTRVFFNASNGKINYTRTLEYSRRNDFNLLTIGDSFSDLGSGGYNSYLGDNSNIKILQLDNVLTGNPIEDLSSLENGDFFDHYNFKFVILECVERNIVTNVENIDIHKIVTNSELNSKLRERSEKIKLAWNKPEERLGLKFHSNRIIKFSANTIEYFFTNTCLFDKLVYKTRLSDKMFSVDNQNLLFLKEDVTSSQKNNITGNVHQLNSVLNTLNERLSRRGIRLIVLPAPDKYDAYYEYIIDKKGFPKPMFFDELDKMKKDYIYIDSKKILSKAIPHTKDIYQYDDSHWSPWAAKLIARDIKEKMAGLRKMNASSGN